MEQTATGSNKVPFYPSKLQELLKSDRTTRRNDCYADTPSIISVASVSGNSLATAATDDDDQSERGRKMTKWKSDAANGGDTGDTNQGLPASSCKVAPIVLKKYQHQSAQQSAECEEFFVSLSEDDKEPSDGVGSGTESPKNSGVKLKEDDYEYMGAQIDKLLSMPSPKSSWKAPRRQRKFQCDKCSKSYSTEDDLKSHELSHSEGQEKPFKCCICDKKFAWAASRKTHMQKIHKVQVYENNSQDEDSPSKQEVSSPTKSNSPGDDQKSPKVGKSGRQKPKPFKCSRCFKGFSWNASLKVHMQKFHNITVQGRNSNEKNSPSKQDVSVSNELQEETKNDIARKLVSTNSVVSPPREHESFNSVINKILSPGLVSGNKELPVVEKSPSLRRQRSNSDIKEMPSTRSASRKEHKSNINSAKIKRKYVKKQAASSVNDEVEETVSPQTPTTGRTSLRRNIQRPKWLTDADLVTDYEFPRGTNAARMGNTTPSPSTGMPIANGNISQLRTMSTDSADNTTPATKSQKTEKSKSEPSPPASSRERKRKEEVQKDKDEPKPKKHDGTMKRAERKKSRDEKKLDKRRKKMRLSTKDNSLDQDDDKESPTKSLSTKILSLRLDDVTGQESPEKLQAGKIAQKRTGSESSLSSTSNRRSKRIKSLDADEKNKQLNGIPLNDANIAPPEATVVKNEQASVQQDSIVGNVETANGACISEPSFDTTTQETEINSEEKGSDSVDTDTTDAKKLEEGTVNCDSGELNQGLVFEESVAALPRDAQHIADITVINHIPTNTVEFQNTTTQNLEVAAPETSSTVDDQVNTSTCESQSSIVGKNQEEQTQVVGLPSVSVCSFFNTGESITFADIAKSSNATGEENDLQNQLVIEDRRGEAGVNGRAACLETVTIPLICNDEEMPILRPETSSSAAASRSDSFAERFASVDADEDMSGNSNHSTVPQAPVLSKEAVAAAATFANGFLQIAKTSRTESTGSTVPDPQDELPLVDEEGDDDDDVRMASRLHRDRSDSLSMRSCGSGSQSEKIKALEDSTSKDKRIMPEHDCLVDSDSNDSLMSEFSELAAQLSEKTDGVKFKEECLRFITTKVSANSMWLIRKELKRLKKDKNYFKFGKLSPLAAGLMHDIFCQSLR